MVIYKDSGCTFSKVDDQDNVNQSRPSSGQATLLQVSQMVSDKDN